MISFLVTGGESGTLLLPEQQAGALPLIATKADCKVESAQLVVVAKKIAGVWDELAAWLSPELFSTLNVKEIARDHRSSFCQARRYLRCGAVSLVGELLVDC